MIDEKHHRAINIGILGVPAYIALQGIFGMCSLFASQPLRTQESLDLAVEQERHRLGIEAPVTASFGFSRRGFGHCETRHGSDGLSYHIVLDMARNRAAVRHEMFHAFADEVGYDFLPGVEESLATLYQAFG